MSERPIEWLVSVNDQGELTPWERQRVLLACRALIEVARAAIAADEGMKYAEEYCLTPSQAAEMRSFCNGYEGSPDLCAALAALPEGLLK
jgi:hypothetical protein